MNHIVTRRLLAFGVAGALGLGLAGVAVAQDAQPDAAKRGMRGHRGHGRMHGLNLTAEQQEKLKALREEHHQRVMEILTPEQRQQLQQARQNRRAGRMGGARFGMRNFNRGERPGMAQRLNLTAEQQEKLKAAREEFTKALQGARGLQGDDRMNAFRSAREKYREAVQGVLTDEQKEQLKSFRQQRRPVQAAPAVPVL